MQSTPQPTSTPADRPNVTRRDGYAPSHPVEQFIVTLLADRIGRHLSDLQTWAAGRPSRRALDIGCGRQPFRSRLAEIGFDYVGFDVHQNTENNVDEIGLIDGDLPESLRRRGPFDLLLCTEVLEHVADWGRAFANIAELMAPGARLLVTCPHFYQLHEEPYDFWRPTPHALRHYADKAGLKVLRIEQAGDGWDVLGTWLPNVTLMPATPSLLDRFLAKGARFACRLLFNAIKRGRIRQRLRPAGSLYLSNVALFEKPTDDGPTSAGALQP